VRGSQRGVRHDERWVGIWVRNNNKAVFRTSKAKGIFKRLSSGTPVMSRYAKNREVESRAAGWQRLQSRTRESRAVAHHQVAVAVIVACDRCVGSTKIARCSPALELLEEKREMKGAAAGRRAAKGNRRSHVPTSPQLERSDVSCPRPLPYGSYWTLRAPQPSRVWKLLAPLRQLAPDSRRHVSFSCPNLTSLDHLVVRGRHASRKANPRPVT
jgi:hypothetical protein